MPGIELQGKLKKETIKYPRNTKLLQKVGEKKQNTLLYHIFFL